jgi:hypothetical protein
LTAAGTRPHLQVSPADDLHRVSDTIMRNFRALQGV